MPNGSGLFSDLFTNMKLEIEMNSFKEKNYGSSVFMSLQEKHISFLNRYFIYIKINNVDTNKIVIDQEDFDQMEILKNEMDTKEAIEIGKEEVQKFKPKIRKLNRKLILIPATEAIDDTLPSKNIENQNKEIDLESDESESEDEDEEKAKKDEEKDKKDEEKANVDEEKANAEKAKETKEKVKKVIKAKEDKAKEKEVKAKEKEVKAKAKEDKTKEKEVKAKAKEDKAKAKEDKAKEKKDKVKKINTKIIIEDEED